MPVGALEGLLDSDLQHVRQTRENGGLDPLGDCLWVGFVPSRAEMATARRLKKPVWLSLNIGDKRPDIWNQARASQMDGICTDWPLECRSLWRKGN